MGGPALVQALRGKVWPELRVLGVLGNRDWLRDEGVVAGLVAVLERRACLYPRLKMVCFGGAGLDQKRDTARARARLAALLKELDDQAVATGEKCRWWE